MTDIRLIKNLGQNLNKRVTYVLRKIGESEQVELNGFSTSELNFTSSGFLDKEALGVLQRNIQLIDSPHGGTAGFGKTAVPFNCEEALRTFASDYRWELIKLEGQQFEILNQGGFYEIDDFTLEDNLDGSYNISINFASAEFQDWLLPDGEPWLLPNDTKWYLPSVLTPADFDNAQLLFEDEKGNQEVLVIKDQDTTISNHVFENLNPSEISTWVLKVLVVSKDGISTYSSFPSPLPITVN